VAKSFHTALDLGGHAVENLRLQGLSADPDPSLCTVYTNTTTGRVRVYDPVATAWVDAAPPQGLDTTDAPQFTHLTLTEGTFPGTGGGQGLNATFYLNNANSSIARTSAVSGFIEVEAASTGNWDGFSGVLGGEFASRQQGGTVNELQGLYNYVGAYGGTTTRAAGQYSKAILSGGSVGTLVGSEALLVFGATGTVTDARTLSARAPTYAGVLPTSLYGLYIEEHTGATTSYNLFSAGATSQNHLEGALSVDGTFQVDGLATLSGGANVTGTLTATTLSGALPWADITGKPTTFDPSAHSHTLSDITASGAAVGQVPYWTGAQWLPVTLSDQGLNTTSNVQFAGLTLVESAPAEVPLTVKGAASQTADLARFQNSAGADLVRIEDDGYLRFSATSARVINFDSSATIQTSGNGTLTLKASNSNGFVKLDAQDGVQVNLRSTTEGTFSINQSGPIFTVDGVNRKIAIGKENEGAWSVEGKDGNNSGTGGVGFAFKGGDVAGSVGAPGAIYFRGGQNADSLVEGNVHFGIDDAGLARGKVLVGTLTDDGVNLLQVAGDTKVTGTLTATTLSGALALTDLGQAGATTGQVLAWNGTEWAPADDAVDEGAVGSNGPITVPAAVIWAEEDGPLDVTTNGGRQWSFGNGGESSNGITIGAAMDLSAVSYTGADTAATFTVEIEKNGTSVHSFTVTSATTAHETLPSTVPFAAGDRLNFRTSSVTSGGADQSVVAVYFVKSLTADYLEPAAPDGFAVRGVGAGDVTIASNTWTKIDSTILNTIEWSTGSEWSNGTWTCPTSGVYDFNGHVTIKGLSDTKKLVVGLYKNGALYALFSRGSGGIDDNSNPIWSGFGGSITVPMAAGDTAELYVHCNEAVPVVEGDNGYCHFAAYRVDEMTASPAVLDDASARSDKTYSSAKIAADYVSETTVAHGADAATARPTGYDRVVWNGTVAPTNAVDGDVWNDTSS
jgi:hypothetical protein